MIQAHRDTPLRVCLVAPYDLAIRGGGVKHHVFSLANALRARGDSVTILGPASRPVHEPGVVTTGGIVSVESNGSANEMALFSSPFETLEFFRNRSFDVIHLHEPSIPSLGYWVTWLTPGVPKLCTFHAFADSPPLPLRVGQKLIGALLYPLFKRGLAVSGAAAEYAARAWTRPLSIVPNGVDTKLFTPPVSPRASTDVRLLFVGRLGDTRKGWDVLLSAYRTLLASGCNVSLDVVGDSTGVAKLPELPGLRVHGPVPLPELVERYQACDIFVAPSLSQESFGIVLLEAMSAGRAIVCSDIRGYREVAKPAGAAFVRPGDPQALAATILSLALDPMRRIAMQAFNRAAVRVYSWQALADWVREHYLDVIASRSRGAAQRRLESAGPLVTSPSKRLASTNPASSTGIV